ncbi:MAG: AI-2E family transporter [Cyanobacteria bacterium J06634_6]
MSIPSKIFSKSNHPGPRPSSILPLLAGLASIVLIVAGLRSVSSLLSPILLSLFITLVTSPVMSWLKRRGLPGWLAYTLVLLLVLLIGTCSLLFFVVSLNQLTDDLPTYVDQIETQVTALWQWAIAQGVTADDIRGLQWFQPERIFQTLSSLVTALLGIFSDAGLMLLVFVYMLASAPTFSHQLHQGLGTGSPALRRFSNFASSMSTYLLIKSWLGALAAIAQIILMWIMGVDFAVLWGILSFLFNFVPNVGFYIALAPPLLLAFLTLGLWKAIIFGIIYIIINNFLDIVIAPRYLSKGLDLSALVTFLAVIVWTWILGPIGAFLALPLTMMVKVLVLEAFPETQLLAELMGAGDEEDTSIKPSA